MARISTGTIDHLRIDLQSESILQHSRLTVTQGREEEREAIMDILADALRRVHAILYPPLPEKKSDATTGPEMP